MASTSVRSELHHKHKKRVRKAKKKIDNSPPRLLLDLYFPTKNYEDDKIVTKKLEKSNQKLIKNLNMIYRSPATVDHFWKRPQKHFHHKLKWIKETEQKRILKENKRYFKLLGNVESIYSPKNLDKNSTYLKLKHSNKSVIPQWTIKPEAFYICPPNVQNDPSKRKIIFLEISIDDIIVGQLKVQLFNDIVPKSAENFLMLCDEKEHFNYRFTKFYRIFSGLFCLGGDVVNNTGTGGTSMYGQSFPDENYILRHSGPGVISMFKREPDCNDSQFLITFKSLPTLNEKFVVIGRIIKSLKVLERIEKYGAVSGKPEGNIIISACGIKK